MKFTATAHISCSALQSPVISIWHPTYFGSGPKIWHGRWLYWCYTDPHFRSRTQIYVKRKTNQSIWKTLGVYTHPLFQNEAFPCGCGPPFSLHRPQLHPEAPRVCRSVCSARCAAASVLWPQWQDSASLPHCILCHSGKQPRPHEHCSSRLVG